MNRFLLSVRTYAFKYSLCILFSLFFLIDLPLSFSNDTLAEASTNLNTNPVQVGYPGDFIAPFDYLNDIPLNGLDINGNNQADIFNPCSSRPQAPVQNGFNANSGYFDSQVIIATGISGQIWITQIIINAFDPQNLTDIASGTIIPEVGNTGIYVLPFAHRDALEYLVSVESPGSYPGEEYGPVINTCYYPDPLIENIDSLYCSSDDNIILFGSATSDFDDNYFPVNPASELWQIYNQETGQTLVTQHFSPYQLGGGIFTVRFTFDAGNNAYLAANHTGGTVTVEKEVIIWQTPVMSCNSSINVTINPVSCAATIIPALLLSYNPENLEPFSIDVLDPVGNSLGDIVPGNYTGVPLEAVITESCTGSSCSTTITLNDYSAPELIIPDDVTIACFGDTSVVANGMASAFDCNDFNLSYEDNMVTLGCGNPSAQVFRTWTAADVAGNSKSLVQTISIARGDATYLNFPADIEFTCEQYLADATIVDPETDKAGIPNLVDEPLCGLVYTSEDEIVSFCGDLTASFIILRTWYVFDLCGSILFTTDSQGNDNLQFIRVTDDTPPVITTASVSVSASIPSFENGLDECSSVGYIPPPLVTDECNSYTVRIITPIGEADYVNGENGLDGGFIPSPGLPMGTYQIQYIAEDACGNFSESYGSIDVVDDDTPIMICDNFINITLDEEGFGRLFTFQIDEGSRDNCCLGDSKIRFIDEPDSAFRDYIDFYCDNDTLDVLLRIWDCSGNFNSCQTTIGVSDPLSPEVVSNPGDLQISCTEDYTPFLEEDYHAPVFQDNCQLEVNYTHTVDIDECGVGTILRNWVARDNGISPPTFVSQAITLEPSHDYYLYVPTDTMISCDHVGFPEFNLESFNCDLIAASVTADTLVSTEDAICFRIKRIHNIINWCEYDGLSDPLLLERRDDADLDTNPGDSYKLHSDGDFIYRVLLTAEVDIAPSSGYYQYEQFIDVFDDMAPELTSTVPSPFCTTVVAAPDAPCTAPLEYPFTISDNCTRDIMIFYSLRLNNDNLITDPFGTLTHIGEGTYHFEGDYPVGQHSFVISLIDDCSNFSQFELPFEVADCIEPEISCMDSLSFQMGQDGEIILNVSDFLMEANDNCSEVNLSFEKDLDLSFKNYNCDSLGWRSLTLWGSDASGNQSSCQVDFEIVDLFKVCLTFWNVEGTIFTEAGLEINNVNVDLIGDLTMEETTTPTGYYHFLEVISSENYMLLPRKDQETKNGLSTLDLIKINQHILSVALLESPYQIIAADVNKSGQISTLDLIRIRKVILGIDPTFPGNTSWRFIPIDYVFENPTNPLQEDFPEIVLLENLESDTTVNFIGIKTGDVNGSAAVE